MEAKQQRELGRRAVEPADELTIDATRTGWTTVKFRFTDMYTVSEGAACLEPSNEGWIRIFVVGAAAIRTLVRGERQPGFHALRWDGRDDHGAQAKPGVYWIRAVADQLAASALGALASAASESRST